MHESAAAWLVRSREHATEQDMNKQAGFTVIDMFHLVFIIIGLCAVGGWVWNVVKVAGSDFGAITAMLVLRCIGIVVAPLGAVLGFF